MFKLLIEAVECCLIVACRESEDGFGLTAVLQLAGDGSFASETRGAALWGGSGRMRSHLAGVDTGAGA